VDAPPSAVRADRTTPLRSDIQALRALAVAAVILYHLWPNWVSGGYVGVDVFFVISGFLITNHLLSEVRKRGRIHAGRFWARRAIRLVPASMLVLLTTSIAILVWVPQALWRQFLSEVTASVLLVENWRLARESVDYLALGNVASPTQHFWTLSVEEQFYIALPLLVLATTAVARRQPRRALYRVLLVVSAISLAVSVRLTHTAPGIAYFSTLSRAWEFGAGVLLACAGASVRPRAGWAWAGIAMIVATCFTFGSDTSFPGWLAVLPVAGTVLVIAAGRRSSLAGVGRVRPVALLGRVSYSAYLWHWPMIVLVPYITHRALGWTDKVLIAGATVGVAWLSTTFVEDPIRFSPRERGLRRPSVVAAWSVAAMSVVLAVSIGGTIVQAGRDDARTALAAEIARDDPPCLGAEAMDPRLAPCENPDLEGVLVPNPSVARQDDANEAECWSSVCQLGPSEGWTKKLFAVGDSHNNTLIGVYRQLAEANNWRIDVAGKGGCYLTSAAQKAPSIDNARGCERWRSDMIQRAHDEAYDAILVTHASGDRIVVPEAGETLEEATEQGLVEAWNALPEVPILAIVDNPRPPTSSVTCTMAAPPDAATRCAPRREIALRSYDGQVDAARQVDNVRVIDMTDFYCTDTVCPTVIGHVLVYRDTSHLTATYALTLAPYLEGRILEALDGG
jgi:peptidoglycan/LPS O-acetylase OafA/YrhL